MKNELRLNIADIVYEKFDGEIVIINLKTGIYYSILGSGISLWEIIENKIDKDKLISLYVERFSGIPKIGEEVNSFINDLISEKLVLLNPEESVENSISVKTLKLTDSDFKKPVLEKYTDQQELLLLDPIHEVDNFGWPNKKE